MAGMVGAILVGILLVLLLATNCSAKGAKVRVTISKETTYITEPLRPDGYPDYGLALDRHIAQGVTPENNSAVLFWRAMGPKEIDAKIRTEYFRRLGAPIPPEEGEYFQRFEEYAASKSKQAGQELSDEKIEHIYKQVMEGPWKAEQFPLAAQWLQANEKPLALITEASRRPRRYDPVLPTGGGESGEILIGALLPAVVQFREAGRALRIRAMYHLGQGKTADAWEDLLTIHRLARLMGQGPTLVENLVAAALEYLVACQADQVLAAEGNLSAQQALAMRDRLAALPPLPPMADKMDLGERFLYLDAVCSMARKQSLDPFEGGGAQTPGWAKRLEDFFAGVGGGMIDWDVPLRMGNQWYDRLVEAGRKPTFPQRTEAIEAIERDLENLRTKAKDRTSLVLGLLSSPREKVSEQIGGALISLLVPTFRSAYVVDDRSAMVRQLTVCSFALAAYRADQGKYPEQLSDLVPRYLTAVPTDAFAPQKPVIYRRTEEGVIFYSVGPNGKDDGGRSQECPAAEGEGQPKGDDLVVRMKTPTSPSPKQK